MRNETQNNEKVKKMLGKMVQSKFSSKVLGMNLILGNFVVGGGGNGGFCNNNGLQRGVTETKGDATNQ